ncbi:OmpA family protein [Lutibacter sp.]
MSSFDSENIVWQEKEEIKTDVSAIKMLEKARKDLEVLQKSFKDTDGDNVIDKYDVEPNTPKGAMVYANGKAIDTDKDGVIDLIDKCPLQPGKTKDGCPIVKDTDGDNVLDKFDLCPEEPGDINNQGCPLIETITESVNTRIINLAKNIFFDYNKTILRESSKKDLVKIANLMIANPDIKFVIEGHTDRGGSEDYNLELSQKRADAVKKYLVKRGVKEENLKAIGYGYSRPKFNNFSNEEKQLNRRVEIKIDKSIEKDKIIVKQDIIHEVKKGETLTSIAKKYNTTIKDLKKWNNLYDEKIYIGQELLILAP